MSPSTVLVIVSLPAPPSKVSVPELPSKVSVPVPPSTVLELELELVPIGTQFPFASCSCVTSP